MIKGIRYFSKILCIFLCLFMIIFTGACTANKSSETKLTVFQKSYTEFFSTASRIYLYISPSEKERAEAACKTAEEKMCEIEKNISVILSDSDIYRFNNSLSAGETMEISRITYDLLTLAKELYRDTDGAYNPAVALSVDLWGFSPRFSKRDSIEKKPYDRDDFINELPAEKYVTAFREMTDFNEVILDKDGAEERYYITKPKKTIEVDGVVYGMQLDLGGIAKGYACDVIWEILNEYGFTYGYISVGGSSMRLLKNAAEGENVDFTVKIRHPREDDGIFAFVTAKDVGLSTSGDYERYYVIHNKRYSHLISAETGEPIDTNICTACVIGGSSAENDAFTTALCVMGKEQAMKYITDKLSNRIALFVWENTATGKYEVISNCKKSEIKLNGELSNFQLCGYLENGTFIYRPSSVFNVLEIIIATAIAVTVAALIAGLGYRNYVLKRNKTNKNK